MPDPTSDRVVDQLQSMRHSIEQLGDRVDGLAQDNHELRERLAASERARRDLLDQSRQLLKVLDESRRELRLLRGE